MHAPLDLRQISQILNATRERVSQLQATKELETSFFFDSSEQIKFSTAFDVLEFMIRCDESFPKQVRSHAKQIVDNLSLSLEYNDDSLQVSILEDFDRRNHGVLSWKGMPNVILSSSISILNLYLRICRYFSSEEYIFIKSPLAPCAPEQINDLPQLTRNRETIGQSRLSANSAPRSRGGTAAAGGLAANRGLSYGHCRNV